MKRIVNTIASVSCLAALLLTGCSGNDNNNSSVDNDSVENGSVDSAAALTPLNDNALGQLTGIWEQRGYGNIYEYTGDRTTWYTVTENTCLEVATDSGLVGFSPEEIAQSRYNLQENQLTLAFPAEAFPIRLEKLDALPARCEDTVARDSQGILDYVWETFDEYYAFFDLRNVDWPAQYATQLPRVADATDDDALFSLLSDLLSPIDDGHIFLVSDDEDFSPAVARGVSVLLEQGFAAQNEISEFGDWADSIFERFRGVIVSQLDADSVIEHGPLTWGTIDNGSTGYLFILAMDEYAIDAEGEPIDDVTSIEELAAARAAMDMAMADLANTTRLVIDLRLNGGGSDAISIEFAQRFANERQLALSKSARSRDFQSIPVEAWLEPPASGAYLNPVTLIVGADTASAAEIFTIAMKQLPQVTIVGERTAGILSDVLIKPLPNGWAAGLSNEVYLDAQGVSLEAVGVTPDFDVPVFRLEDLDAGVDPALTRALAL